MRFDSPLVLAVFQLVCACSAARMSTSETVTSTAPPPAGSSAASERDAPSTGEHDSRHWSFAPPQRPALPGVRARHWVRNPIDAFVLARLEQEGIEPSPQADPVTLVRRLYLDLIGLPPKPQDVSEFLRDHRADAYERLVDRLLSSEHYGEKWARHWLDLARYADSDGYETDQLRPVAWRYRQWVIEALNRDLPFDQFTVEQVAGDLLPGATIDQRIATGFHRNTLSNREGGADLEEYRVEQAVDRVATLGITWLGLGLGCARCHDHKYDPITQRDFYQVYAFFNNVDEVNIPAPLPGEIGTYLRTRPEYEAKRKELLADVTAEIAELEAEWEAQIREAYYNPGKDYRWDRACEVLGLVWGGNLGWGQLEGLNIVLHVKPAERTPRQRERLEHYFIKHGSLINPDKFKELKLEEFGKKLDDLLKSYPELAEAPTIVERVVPRTTAIHMRGDFRSPGAEVSRGTPAAFHRLPPDPPPSRLTLAHWLVSSQNPLTARVAVNRAWQEFFGRGLVATSEDFGTQGDRPSHPELLDWLAIEFQTQGWSLKRLHKLIVMSATYRQSSRTRPELAASDPNNRLLARQSRIRLPAELIRDSALAVSGLLNPTIGGPSVRPPQPESVAKDSYDNPWIVSQGPDRYRRGLYTWLQRTSPFAQSVTFDAADVNRSCSRRERSNTPLQALTLLNDSVSFEAAQVLAARMLTEHSGGVSERIDYLFQLALARAPTAHEHEHLLGYYNSLQAGVLAEEPESPILIFPARLEGTSRQVTAAWTVVASIVLNLDEFITRE